jgi:hypothetical protein
MKVKSKLIDAQLEDRASSPTKGGEILVNTSASNQVQYHDSSSVRTVVNTDQAQTLTNKSISGDDNTITGVKSNNVDFDNTGSNILATNVEMGLKENRIYAEAVDSDLASHVNADAAHGVTGNVVGTTDTQTLTNKTIDGDDNTIQDLGLSSLKTEAGDSGKFIERDGSGNVISGKAVPTGNVVGTTDAQTLSSKTFSDEVRLAEISTPATPSSGEVKVYAKNDGSIYKLASDGIEREVGSGAGGSGSKNYFDAESADFDGGTVGGWETTGTITETTPMDFTGGSGAIGPFTSLLANKLTLSNERIEGVTISYSGSSGGVTDMILRLVGESGGEPDMADELASVTFDLPGSSPKAFFSPEVTAFRNLGKLSGTYFLVLDPRSRTGNLNASVLGSQPVDGTTFTSTDDGATWTDRDYRGEWEVFALEIIDNNFLTVDVDDTNPIAGEYSLAIEKGAGDAEGEVALCQLKRIDRGDRGKTVFASCQIDATHVNYLSGGLRVEVWDMIRPVPQVPQKLYTGPEPLEILKSQGRIDFPVSLDATTELVEFRFVVNNDDTNAYTVLADEFRLGPAAQVSTAFRRQVEIDLAGSGDFTGGKILVSREGGLVSVSVLTSPTFTSNSQPQSSLGLIPLWARPEATKSALYFNSSAPDTYRVSAEANGRYSFLFRESDTGSLRPLTTAQAVATVSYSVEDNQSQVMTTNELGLQSGAFRASRNGTDQTGVNPNNSAVKVNINSIASANDYAKGLSYDEANARFVNLGPDAVFDLSAGLNLLATNVVTGARYRAEIRVNGTSRVFGTQYPAPAAAAFTLNASGSFLVPRNGTVELYLHSSANHSTNQLTVTGDINATFLAGTRRPDLTLYGAVKGQGEGHAVGDIKQSMLTEAQFTAIHGDTWVLMDGRSVSGSRYASITGNSTVPDARGRHLRSKSFGANSVTDWALGNVQADAVGGHTHPFSADSTLSGGAVSSGNGTIMASNGAGLTRRSGGGAPLFTTNDSVLTNNSTNENRVKQVTVNTFIKIN